MAASRRQVTSGRLIGQLSQMDRTYMKSPVKTVVSTTPMVESISPGPRMGRISFTFVSIPPENRMTHREHMPMNWACFTSLNCSPSPSTPKSIPATRKSRREGRPKRYPALLMSMLLNIRTDRISNMFSEVNVIFLSVFRMIWSSLCPFRMICTSCGFHSLRTTAFSPCIRIFREVSASDVL